MMQPITSQPSAAATSVIRMSPSTVKGGPHITWKSEQLPGQQYIEPPTITLAPASTIASHFPNTPTALSQPQQGVILQQALTNSVGGSLSVEVPSTIVQHTSDPEHQVRSVKAPVGHQILVQHTHQVSHQQQPQLQQQLQHLQQQHQHHQHQQPQHQLIHLQHQQMIPQQELPHIQHHSSVSEKSIPAIVKSEGDQVQIHAQVSSHHYPTITVASSSSVVQPRIALIAAEPQAQPTSSGNVLHPVIVNPTQLLPVLPLTQKRDPKEKNGGILG